MITVKPHECVKQLIVSDLVAESYHTRTALSCHFSARKVVYSPMSKLTHFLKIKIIVLEAKHIVTPLL